MSAPLSTSRNKYHNNIKNSTVFTPEGVSQFIFDILEKDWQLYEKFYNGYDFHLLDSCIGTGNLVKPFRKAFNDMFITGIDLELYEEGKFICNYYYNESFLSIDLNKIACKPNLVIQNTPFNTDKRNKDWLKKNKKGKALLPELFLDKIFKTWGRVPVITISPMGVRLNQRMKSKRWKKYSKLSEEKGIDISSIASLPLDIFPNVEFHVEIQFWNMPELRGHYWFEEKYLPDNSLKNGIWSKKEIK